MFNSSNQEFLFSTKSGIVEASSRQSTPPFKHFLDSSRRFDLEKHFFACKISKEHLKTKKLLTFYISRCKRILLTNSCHWSLTSRAQKNEPKWTKEKNKTTRYKRTSHSHPSSNCYQTSGDSVTVYKYLLFPLSPPFERDHRLCDVKNCFKISQNRSFVERHRRRNGIFINATFETSFEYHSLLFFS